VNRGFHATAVTQNSRLVHNPGYTLDTEFERLFVYVKEPNTELDEINIRVLNRPLYKRCSEDDQDPLKSGKPTHRTDYRITFLQGAYRRGAQNYSIAFEYDPPFREELKQNLLVTQSPP
jgi:hypothetical protein